jgi:hypothetical protein
MHDIELRVVTPENIDALALSQPDELIELLDNMPAHEGFWHDFEAWMEAIK